MVLLLASTWPLLLLLATFLWPASTLWVTQCLLVVLGLLTLVDGALAHTYASVNAIKKEATRKPLALVTGASAGLGKEMVRLLAQKGYSLVLVARREELLQQLQEELKNITTDVTYCVADLATAEGINGVIEFVRSQKLEVDVLINNAGASVRGELTSLSMDQVESFIQLNVVAATKLTRALVPGMVERRRGGQVLIVSSMASEMANPKAAIYGASKAFLTRFAQSVNHELLGTGVTVTAFLPGPLHTEFGQHADCQTAVYMNMPGRASVLECAEAAIAAMEDPLRTFAFEKWTTWFMTTAMSAVFPRRVSTTLTALSMEDPEALVQKLLGGEKKAKAA